MGIASKEARKVVEQKKKYWLKVLSDGAIDAMFYRMFDIFDYLSFWGDWVISDTLFSSLISLVFFDLAIPEITPWTLTWEVELPSVDEFLAGVLIKLEPIKIELEIPEVREIDATVDYILEPEYSAGVKETRGKKLIVGKTKYGEGYVDPPAVREFFRSTVLAFLKKDYSMKAVRERLESARKTWNIAPEVIEEFWNRLVTLTSIKENALTWDYGWWDRSSWSEEGSSGKVPIVNYQGEEVEVEYEHAADAKWGGHWDLSRWDYFCWTAPESPFKVEEVLRDSNVSIIRDLVVSKFRSRITLTPFIIANYQKTEGREKWSKSPRTETYALPMSQRYRLESLVDSVVRQLKPDIDVIRLRLYKSAILDLYGMLFDPHRWGAEAQRASTRDEIRKYWIEKWRGHGLDEFILGKLFDALYDTIVAYGAERARMRLRFLKYRMRIK